jgi:hypothetical protein
MARKTIEVAQILEWVNTRLEIPDSTHKVQLTWSDKPITPEQAFRLGVASLLEQILHATDTYAGFGYTKTRDETVSSGVIKHVPVDETRRNYYRHRKLR